MTSIYTAILWLAHNYLFTLQFKDIFGTSQEIYKSTTPIWVNPFRPNKKISVFPVTGLKIVGRVGTQSLKKI